MTNNQPNRDERSERNALSEEVASRHRGAGAGVNVLMRVQKAHPGDPKKQLAAFLRDFVIMSGTGRLRPVSAITSTRYTDNLMKVIDDLRAERAAIKNLSELGKPHVLRLIGAWVRDGQSEGTIQNKVTYLRRFLIFLGKENLIPRGVRFKDWLIENDVQPPGPRSIVARTSKAWNERGVNVYEIVKKVEGFCQFTAIHLEMQVAFGLRMKESLQIIPAVADRGTVLSVVWGTKGGLPREVRFDEEEGLANWQRDVLERAKVMAAQNRKGTLSVPGKTLMQSIDHFYYVMRKFNISRKGLGVTAHGLRHQFAARRYQQIAGFGAPVTAHAPGNSSIVAEVDLAARAELSRELGHFRPSITQAYTGSFRMRKKDENKCVEGYIEITERNPNFWYAMEPFEIERTWLAGKFASGEPVNPSDKMRLILAPKAGIHLSADQRFLLRSALNEVIPRGVDLAVHYDTDSPDDAVELFRPKE